MYAVENKIRVASPYDLRDRRQELSVPIIAGTCHFLKTNVAGASRKGKLRRRDPLCAQPLEGTNRFLNSRRFEIVFNAIEKSIRPLASTESLFADSTNGGHRWAVIDTSIETPKFNRINLQGWLADAL